MGLWGQIGSGIATQGGATWELGLGLIGRALAQGDIDKANQIYYTIAESIGAERLPEFNKLLAQEVPEAAQVIGRGEGRQAQGAALANLQSFVDQQGLDAQARAMNEEALMAADQRAKGARGALMQSYARRGQGGGGQELAGQLQANQAAANQGRQASLDIAGQARQRALDALGKQASVGTSMRGQDIDVEGKNAAAKNARDQFNAKMRRAAQEGNNELLQQDFRNRMAKQQALNKARGDVAQRHLAGAKQTQSDWSGVGKAQNYKHQAAADDLEDMPF